MRSVTLALVLGALCAAENVHQTKPGLTAVLQCGFSDSSGILKWLRGTEQLHSVNLKSGPPLKGRGEIVARSRLKNEKDLEISKITAKDAGLFTCSVNGQMEEHRLVVSSASVSPSERLEVGSGAVLQCNVAGLPQGETVEWVRPGGGQRERTSRLSVTAVTQADAGTWECVFSANGKTMKETVILEVTARRPSTTAANLTTGTTKPTVTTCPDCGGGSLTADSPALVGLSWWVWAAVGGGCLVVLLWVLILVMYNRMKRRRRRFMKMRNAGQLRPKQYCQCPGGPTAAAGHRGKKPSAPPFTAPVAAVL